MTESWGGELHFRLTWKIALTLHLRPTWKIVRKLDLCRMGTGCFRTRVSSAQARGRGGRTVNLRADAMPDCPKERPRNPSVFSGGPAEVGARRP